jgi:hypothetical protein
MPSEVGAEDAEALRAQGLDDAAISDAIQVISYFNYINRVAEGVGTDAEPEWASPSELSSRAGAASGGRGSGRSPGRS